jgi:hypothetical protein
MTTILYVTELRKFEPLRETKNINFVTALDDNHLKQNT